MGQAIKFIKCSQEQIESLKIEKKKVEDIYIGENGAIYFVMDKKKNEMKTEEKVEMKNKNKNMFLDLDLEEIDFGQWGL